MSPDKKKTPCRYFRCEKGHVVPRWGVPGNYIGAHKAPGGFVFHDDEVVAIPESEIRKYWREYNRSIKDKSWIEVKEKTYNDSVDKIEARV
jgi:hypothetical protein